MIGLLTLAAACSTPTPTPTPSPLPTLAATPTHQPLPTAIDSFYGTPASYTRSLGKGTQTVRLGISPDFATRPILPLYALGLSDKKYVERFFEALTRNHFFRWQEADWQNRSTVTFDEFAKRLAAGEDLSYPAMDTRNGGAGAHVAKVNPAADMDILLIPRHDGFVTFPGSPTDPGLSVKNTINDDGSQTVRVPVVYAQIFTYSKGAPEIQDIVRNSIVIALMELGIPPRQITENDLKGINTWWEEQPKENAHRIQYALLRELLNDELDKPIIRVWDEPPPSP